MLTRAQVLRIGLCHNNVPYVLPVCFEPDLDVEIVQADSACDWAVEYRSLIGFGKAFIVEDYEDKIEALNITMGHYSDRYNHQLRQSAVDLAAIIRIEIESITGKRSKE